VYACPVNCIHPTPDEPDFHTSDMLYIDPAACVDCGACVAACPVEAIKPEVKLTVPQQKYVAINADFYVGGRARPLMAPVPPAPAIAVRREPLRVAIVGSGPAAMYAADELLTRPGVRVDVYERLSQPYGLARYGVAPDHQQTRQVAGLFDVIARQSGFRLYLNTEVGKELSANELRSRYHGVIYAVGAATDRKLGIDGEGMPGTSSATDFVAWYNGHPDHAGDRPELSHECAVVIGNGNVALDVARILASDPERLAATDISPAALEALRSSKIREIVLAGRRGPAQSACTVPELAGLLDTANVVLDPAELVLDPDTAWREHEGTLGHELTQQLRLLRAASAATSRPGKRITMRYLLTPIRITGSGWATGVDFAHNELVSGGAGGIAQPKPDGHTEHIAAGLILSSIGYRGVPVPGLPFDAAAAVVPNDKGRVEPGRYVVGWIKRGPTGFIGTNKSCAQQTVRQLVDDYNADLL
jgi:ferredoxin--NADP+ reductase